MNINILKEGQTFKNYKELCSELGMEEKSGKSRQLQMKDLERFCTYHKDKRKFIIDEVKNNPLPKVDKRGKSKGSRGNNKRIYGNWVLWSVVDLLAQEQNNGKLCISKSELLRSIGITNPNYGFLMNYKPKIARKVKADEMIIDDFYRTNNVHFNRIIKSTLDELVDKKMIFYNTFKMVKRKTENIHKLADDDDINIILKTETDILKQMGFDYDSEMIKSGKFIEYWNKVNKAIKDNSDIEFYYSVLDIHINQYYINDELNSLLDLLIKDAKRKEVRTKLNKRVMKHLLDNAKKRHQKEKEKEKWNPFDVEDYRCNEDYVAKIDELINLLIDKDTPNQVDEIKKINIKKNTDEIENKLSDFFK